MPPFLVMALPRSRTAWLSRFLSYGEWHCGHEEMRHLRSMDDVKSWFSQAQTGSAETSAAPWWRTVLKMAPGTRIVVIRRPVGEVVDSLMRLGLFTDREALVKDMVRLDRKLDQIEKRVPGVLSVPFASLAEEATCARVFEHCLPYPHDPAWWAHVAPQNTQINMRAVVRHYQANKSQLDKVVAQARWAELDAMHREPVGDPEGVTIQQEGFDTFYRDVKKSFAAHLVETDQHPEEYLRKNLGLMKSLDDMGSLQIVTGRSNGRVFGYLVTVIGPSLDSYTTAEAQHTMFFADPAFKGLGMKIQRHARDALKAKGVGDLIFRAGIRGSGPRLGSMYRRLGAEPFGSLFRLQL